MSSLQAQYDLPSAEPEGFPPNQDEQGVAALSAFTRIRKSVSSSFLIDCIVHGLQKDAVERLDKFVAARKDMEAAARNRFP